MLELGEASFDTVPLLIKGFVVLSFGFAVGSGRNDWFCATCLDMLHNRIGIIAFVSEHILWCSVA